VKGGNPDCEHYVDRTRRYCSHRCQTAAWRQRHGLLPARPVSQPCATGCGRPAERDDAYCLQCQLDGSAPEVRDEEIPDLVPSRRGRPPRWLAEQRQHLKRSA
jgi:hypothetical protein